jgi:L-asparaginase
VLLSALASPVGATPPGVAVLRAAVWSPGDSIRDGAVEFEVLMCAARLQRSHRAAAIVGVGDRHGLFVAGAERALRMLTLRGMPVAKLARGGDVAADPDQLFLDATGLTEAEASSVLVRCLEHHGTPPPAANPEQPTTRELVAIRAHLQPFREALAVAAAPRLANR